MDYKHLSRLTQDGTMYINDDMGTTEALLPTGSYATAHAPALLELDNGDMLCAWFAGSCEGNKDIIVVCARKEKNADHWSEPVPVSYDKERSEQNPSLFQGPDGAVWCMYTAQMDRVEGKDNMQYTSVIRCQKSWDGGRTWGEAEVIFSQAGNFCRQPIQVLSNGRWIFGNWLCTDSERGLEGDPTIFRISDDQGKTWKTVDMPESHGLVHANVVELKPDQLICLLRSRFADHIYISVSQNNGDSWTEPIPTILPNNNSSISAIKLNSGRVAIAYNPTHAPHPIYGKISWPGLRCPVAIALSEDGCKTFPYIRHVERGEGFTGDKNAIHNKQYEYPYLMQGRDGRLHLAYAYKNRTGIKYMSFSEEDITGKLPS